MRQYAHRHGRRFPRHVLRRAVNQLRSRVTAASLVMILSLAVYANCFADKNTFVISHENGVTVHETYTQDPRIVLMEAGIYIGENDYVSLPDDLSIGKTAQIEIIRAKNVYITLDGETRKVVLLGGTVADALQRLSYEQGTHDLITPDAERLVEDGMRVTVTRFALDSELEHIVLPYETEYLTSDDLPPGEERLAIAGEAGSREIEYELTLRDGVEISRRLLRDEIVREPVAEIIEVGAERPVHEGFPGKNAVMPVANAGTLTLPNGTTLQYTHTMKAVATAYTTERQTRKTNASGLVARVGTIAVDPTVIPLGSQVYVVAADGTWVYGTAVCEDTGGAIKGNTIDLFFDKYDECISFGRRAATVYIIKKGW